MRVVSISLACALAAAAILAIAPGVGSAKSPRSACDISGQEQDLGASYVTSVKARNVGCGKALKVVRAYNECRKEHGGADSRNCPERVRGFKCGTTVLAESPAQFDAKFNCKRGDQRVRGSYTQNI